MLFAENVSGIFDVLEKVLTVESSFKLFRVRLLLASFMIVKYSVSHGTLESASLSAGLGI
jgi:hypothetical protein